MGKMTTQHSKDQITLSNNTALHWENYNKSIIRENEELRFIVNSILKKPYLKIIGIFY